jgi:hypothetical protein
VLFVPFGSLRPFDTYLESAGHRRSQDGAAVRTPWWPLLRRSNLALWLVLFALWIPFAVVGGALSGVALGTTLRMTGILLSFYFVLALLLELHVTYSSRYAKIGLLLGFLALLYLFLPPIMDGILDAEQMYRHSPLGYFFGLLVSETEVDMLAGADAVWSFTRSTRRRSDFRLIGEKSTSLDAWRSTAGWTPGA